MSEKIKQRCLFPALAHHSLGVQWVCGSSSPGQPFPSIGLEQIRLQEERHSRSLHSPRHPPFPLSGLDYLCLSAPSSRDWLLFRSNKGKSRFCGSAPYPEGLEILSFSFLQQMGQISRNYFSSVICLHKKNQLLEVLEGSLLPAKETLSFVSLRVDFYFYIYTHTE